MPKLTHSQRLEIARAYQSGESPKAIGMRYGTTGGHVINIARRATQPPKRRPKEKRKRVYLAKPKSEAVVKPIETVDQRATGAGIRHVSGYVRLI